MIVGIPKEIKEQENRVAITPAGVDALTRAGHTVYVEKDAGMGAGLYDAEYEKAGARILKSGKEVYAVAEMVLKVKEPLAEEYDYFREGQVLFTYLHLAPDPNLTQALLARKIIGIAYETVQLEDGSLPLLAPMSEVAGRMSVQVGAWLLESTNGGRGMLLGGVAGVEKAHVVVIGGGGVGINAAKMAYGMGARVTVLDISAVRMSYLDDVFDGHVETLMSNAYNIEKAVSEADLVVGAVLIPGAKTPKLVKEYMVKGMKQGSVLVDVAIDQGGSIETMDRVTTHEHSYFIKHGVIHYSVANMPGAVSRTSTFALTNATLPYVLQLAQGAEQAMNKNVALKKGLNLYKGNLVCQGVADAQDLECVVTDGLF